MDKYVIRGIAKEDDIKLLHEYRLLDELASCSKELVVSDILAYIEDPSKDFVVTELLCAAYKEKIEFFVQSQSEEMDTCVKEVIGYNYYTPYAELSIEQLSRIKDNIAKVTEESVMKPYIEPISSTIIAGILNNLLGLYKVNKDIRFLDIYDRLKKNKEAFRDKSTDKVRGTKFKKFSRMTQEFELIVNGVDFLIGMKAKDKSPDSWRWF